MCIIFLLPFSGKVREEVKEGETLVHMRWGDRQGSYCSLIPQLTSNLLSALKLRVLSQRWKSHCKLSILPGKKFF